MRRWPAALIVAAVAACSGGGDDGRADKGLGRAEAERAVEETLLDEDDLGDGWDEEDRIAADDVEAGATPVDTCIGADLRERIVAHRLAESDTVQLSRDGEDIFSSTRVTMSTTAFEDTAVIDALLALADDERLAPCLADVLRQHLGEGADAPLVAGEPMVEDDYVTLDDVRSVHVSVPLRAATTDIEFEAELDVVLVARGQLLSTLVTVAIGGAVDGEDVVRWATLIADRQRVDD